MSSLRPYKRCRTVSPPPPWPTCSAQTVTPALDNLPVEIILRIVEELGWNPATIGLFMRTSHAISNVIKANETSLAVHFTSHLPPTTYYSPKLLCTAPSRTRYIEPSPITSTLRRLVRALSFTSGAAIPPFADFLFQFNTAMRLHHPGVPRLPVDGLVRIQKTFLEAKKALGWAYHHNTRPPQLPFEASPKIAEVVERGMFEWVAEVHIREKIKEDLPKSNLFNLKRIEIAAIFQAQPQLCHCCHGEACKEHISFGITLLYKMWDARIGTFREGNGPYPHPSRCSKSVCESPSECVARDNVEEWIQLQDAETLAHLLEIIWIASQLYDFSGCRSRDFSGCEHSADDSANGHTDGHSNSADPTRSWNEGNQQWDIVEMECIFREMCLESGPAFLYACRPPQKGDTTKDKEKRQWAIQLMQRGVKRLHAYEAGELVDEEQPNLIGAPPNTFTTNGVQGHAEGYAEAGNGPITASLPGVTLLSTPMAQYVPRKTLQATLLQRFCHLQECDLRIGWDEVFHVNAISIDKIKSRMEEETARAIRQEEERIAEAEKLRRYEVLGLWFKGMKVEGVPWDDKDGVREGKTVADCPSVSNDWVGDPSWKEKAISMPGSSDVNHEGKEERNNAFTANGEQAREDDFTADSSEDGANLSFKFDDPASRSASVAGRSKRARAYSAICDGQNHGDNGECVLDGLLWDVEDSEKWNKMEEFVGNNLDPPRKDKGKGKAVI